MAVFKPSKYQEAIFKWIKEGSGDAVINSVPGSGKTTVLVETAKRLPQGSTALVCSFNKHIAEELGEKMPKTSVTSSTINAFGFSVLRENKFWTTLDRYKYIGSEGIVAQLVSRYCPDLEKEQQAELKDAANSMVNMARLTLTGPNSLDAIKATSWAFNPNQPDDQKKKAMRRKFMDELAQMAFEFSLNQSDLEIVARVVIDALLEGIMMASNKSKGAKNFIDFPDQIWLPVVLRLPARQYDYVMVDESQDLSRCQLNLVVKARRPGGRMLFVGDKHQCQPEGTMVRTTKNGYVPIESLKVGDEVASYDRNGSTVVGLRNQGRKVLAVSSRDYHGELLTVQAADKNTQCTPNHKWVVRFTERTTDVFVTYLMRQGTRYRIGWCQLFDKHGGLHLGCRARIEKADAAWILGVHDNRTDASVEESILAGTYGLPTLPFEPVNGANHITRDAIDAVFNGIEARCEASLEIKASACLTDFGRELAYPFWTYNGLGVKTGDRQRQGRSTIFETQACNLIGGLMSVPVFNGTRNVEWFPLQLERQWYKGQVYSLQVETHETYIADGLVTHNSIYMFAGADSASMDKIQEKLNCTELPLSICYRCPKSHVELAASIYPGIEPRDDAPQGELSMGVSEDWAIQEALPTLDAKRGYQDMFICRNTAPLVSVAYRLIRSGKPAKVRGKQIGEGLTAFVDKVLRWGRKNNLKDWESFDLALQGFVNEKAQEARDSLKEGIREAAIEALNDKAETIRVIKSTKRPTSGVALKDSIIELFAENGNQTIWLSTVHRSKGLECRRTFIVESQLMPSRYAKTPEAMTQEMNLIYISYTRATQSLFILEPRPKGEDVDLSV